MKRITLLLSVAFALVFSSCSQCYECSTQSYITDGSGNILDSTRVTEDICTADATVIDEKEADGLTTCVRGSY